jgi:SAM-dependent methyltransferase
MVPPLVSRARRADGIVNGPAVSTPSRLRGAEIVSWQLWDGSILSSHERLLAPMDPFMTDLRRPDDPVLMTWFEHTQWRWKRWEYASVIEAIDPSLHAGARVLDAGCGYTPLVRYLASLGMEAYGFDWDVNPVESQLDRSSRLLYGDRVRYHKQDLRSLEWPSDFFDFTVSVSVLEHLFLSPHLAGKLFDYPLPPSKKFFHVRNVRQAVEELVRVTKPGGRIILTLDCGYGAAIRPAVIEQIFGVHIERFPDPATIRSYWAGDPAYMNHNELVLSVPREYTGLFIVLARS